MTATTTGTAPRRPAARSTTTTGATPAAEAKQASLQQHLATLADCDVMDPEGFYAWSEALRALSSGMSFFVHAASSQFERAARKGAKNSVDGRMTLSQKIEMARVLRKIGKVLDNNAAEDLLATAKEAVRAYGLLEDFLENLESDSVARPHRSTQGGFSLFGGR